MGLVREQLERRASRISLVQCADCVHFRAYDRGRNVCDAYPGAEDGSFGPGQIPSEIIVGKVDHNKPYKGDHGIQRKEGAVQMKSPDDDEEDDDDMEEEDDTADYSDEYDDENEYDDPYGAVARFAYNPDEARDEGGRWTAGGAAVGAAIAAVAPKGISATAIKPAGSTTRGTGPKAPGSSWEGRNRSTRGQGGLKAQSEHAVYASLGITPFRGSATPSMADVLRYYSSTRFKGFEAELLKVAAAKHVRVIEETKVAGMWEGNLEPAATITVRGTAGAIRDVANWLGARYYQDSVMVYTPHAPGARGGMYVLDGVKDPNAAMDAMAKNNLPGGRVIGSRLEIADDASEWAPKPEDIAKLATTLGLKKRYTPGTVEWLNAGEAYKKGEWGRG
jgi:hypothetical protein